VTRPINPVRSANRTSARNGASGLVDEDAEFPHFAAGEKT
jgi:hypothetical protein